MAVSDDVKVQIEGMNKTDKEVTSVTCDAVYNYVDGMHFLRYTEVQDNKEIKNIIKISDNRIVVMKSGYVKSKMVFEAGKDNTNDYSTPYGPIKMTVSTKYLKVDENETGLHVEIDYNLCSGGQFLSECNIKINVNKNEMQN